MKFLLRCLLVLAIAIGFGALLYYSVQALPGVSSNLKTGIRLQPEGGRNESDRPAPRMERPENDRRGGLRWRSLLQIARRVLMFSALVLLSIFAKNLIFNRKTNKRPPAD